MVNTLQTPSRLQISEYLQTSALYIHCIYIQKYKRNIPESSRRDRHGMKSIKICHWSHRDGDITLDATSLNVTFQPGVLEKSWQKKPSGND